MKKEELKQIYKDWYTGADEKIRYSDFLCACYEEELTDKEIEEIGYEVKKEIK